MKLTVGQVPLRPLKVSVVVEPDAVTLADYDSVEVVLTNPEGAPVNTAAGVAVVTDGALLYSWPSTSLFATPGDYTLRLKATKGPVVDFSDPAVIEVYREVQP